MAVSAREEYLTTEVMTAAPQKLQLMLLDAAILLCNRAKLHWANGQREQAFDSLVHCQRIITQLISGLAPNLESPLVRQVSAVYSFIYRTLIIATTQRDEAKLNEAVRILEFERETWKLVCDRLGTRRLDAPESIAAPQFNQSLHVETFPANADDSDRISLEI